MFQVVRSLFEIYAFIFGVVFLVLESRQLQIPEAFLNRLYKYALFVKFVWGRGCLYVFAGSMQLVQGGFLDIIVGGFVMFVGVVYVVVGHHTAKKLADLRQNLYSEDTLRAKFREADIEGNGSLTKEQFRTLTLGLGMDLSSSEAEAAFLHLGHDTGFLTFEQFRSWWANYDEDGNSIIV